jgi:Ca-activated chloride channel family protein
LLEQLKPTDTVSIVVYAGAAGTVLAPTKAKDKVEILAAMDKLSAGGSTAGAQGIELAYQLAEQNFKASAVNRIILATDGDFNVGLSDRDQLQDYVERKREKGIFLSVLGFGQGNYQDHLMQSLAQNGNGIAAYIDTLSEAQKVLVHEATSSLFPIANDLKIQVEFNPNVVKEYRLLGYETRALEREDFNNDKVDAGDIGSGHSITAIYEVTLVGSNGSFIDDLRYSQSTPESTSSLQNELAFLKMRYKLPGQSASVLREQAIMQNTEIDNILLREVKFAGAVAGFAQLLKDAKYTGEWTMDDALSLALANRGEDNYGYRSEFVQLIRKAQLAEEL